MGSKLDRVLTSGKGFREVVTNFSPYDSLKLIHLLHDFTRGFSVMSILSI